MSGNFRASFMGRSHSGGKFCRSNEHIRLEIVDALIEPKIDGLRRIVGSGELMHLQGPTASSFKIRSGDVYLRPRRFSRIDLLLKLKIGVGFERARGADGGHSAGQVKTRKAECHLAEHAVAHGIEHVVVHADQAGNDAVTVQVEDLGIFGDDSPTRRRKPTRFFHGRE